MNPLFYTLDIVFPVLCFLVIVRKEYIFFLYGFFLYTLSQLFFFRC